jgi:hypothetical protein
VEGLISGEEAIEHRQRCHQDEPGVGRCSSFLPSDYQFLKMMMRTSTALRDDLGWDKSPEIPCLSNGVDAASPPLVVVGGIAFY